MKNDFGIRVTNVHIITANQQKEKKAKKPYTNDFSRVSIKNFPDYKYILNKLIKYLKQILPKHQYEEIKLFIQSEIKAINTINKNESLSSIFSQTKSEQNSENPSNVQNGPNQNVSKTIPNAKKLKLSYDFSNFLTSPRQNRPIKIEISNSKQKEEYYSTINSNGLKNTIATKDIHSLYTITKGVGHHSNPNSLKFKKKKNPSKTQSNSKSKSTSREFSNNHNGANLNSHQSHNLSGYKGDKVKVKQSLINKSQPLLNGRLFSKLNLASKNYKRHNHSGNNQGKKTHQKFHKNTITSFSKNNLTITQQKNKNRTINFIKFHTNGKSSSERLVQPQCIDLNKSSNKMKNEDLMKQIKNTLDDNLKVIFNFSYENFLRKESESDSKKSSQIEIYDKFESCE